MPYSSTHNTGSYDSWLQDSSAYEAYAGDDPPQNPLDPKREIQKERELAKQDTPLDRISFDTRVKYDNITGMGGDNKHTFQEGTIIVNLTPHEVTLLYPDERLFILKGGGKTIPRVLFEEHTTGTVGPFEVKAKTFGRVENLPPRIMGVYYVVSSLVAQQIRREDFLVPKVKRDNWGNPIGAVAFYEITNREKGDR